MRRVTLTVAALAASAAFSSLASAASAPAPITAATYVPVDRSVTISSVPGVVAAAARWEPVFSSVELQDGILGVSDGVLIAMQDAEIVRKIDLKGVSTIFAAGTGGAGALAMDNSGRLFGVLRKEPTGVAQLAPERRLLAQALPDGGKMGRLSDLVTDLKGGFYVSGAAFYYVNPHGVVAALDSDIQTNGIALSPDGKTLYVTNNSELIAFDVQADGSLRNRRVFSDLSGDGVADGMAVDTAGRVYVACLTGVHVISARGLALGVIPTRRRGTSLAFAGPDKRTLYMLAVGATTSDGKLLASSGGTPTNNARTLYRLGMIAAGYAGRPK